MTGNAIPHITAARESLSRLHRTNISPGSQAYVALAQEATAHAQIAIWDVLDEILALLDRPAIPGLPKGYELTTEQTGNGDRRWRYTLAGPQFSYASRYRYEFSETALTAGLRHAREQEDRRAGQVHRVPDQATATTCGCGADHQLPPLLAAAREAQVLNEPVHVAQNGDRTDVYGIANPEAD